MRQIRMWILQLRAAVLEAEIQNGETLLREHRARLIYAYREMRKVKSELAAITPPRDLINDAMRRMA